MPALYAHNKFGKLVIPKLPSIKETVRKYLMNLEWDYRDLIFIFYLTRKDITKIGVTMHHSVCILLWNMPASYKELDYQP